jgi:hypothetical protein
MSLYNCWKAPLLQVSPLFLESLPGAVDSVPAVAAVPDVAGVPTDTSVLTIVVDAIKLIRLPK